MGVSMPTDNKEFSAIQNILDTLSEFDDDAQKRILNFVLSKLRITSFSGLSELQISDAKKIHPPQSLKSFLKDKKGQNDVRFATAVAYYYKLVAPEDHVKTEITSSDVDAGCDAVGRSHPKDSGHTLRDAKRESYLKGGPKRGTFMIDLAGEEMINELFAKKTMPSPENGAT